MCGRDMPMKVVQAIYPGIGQRWTVIRSPGPSLVNGMDAAVAALLHRDCVALVGWFLQLESVYLHPCSVPAVRDSFEPHYCSKRGRGAFESNLLRDPEQHRVHLDRRAETHTAGLVHCAGAHATVDEAACTRVRRDAHHGQHLGGSSDPLRAACA